MSYSMKAGASDLAGRREDERYRAGYAGCAQRTWLDRLKALGMAHWATTDVCVSSPFSRLGSAGNVSERPPARS
jgi:hypothetical protein